MNTTYKVVVGDRGRLVIPAELRANGEFEPGTDLTMIATTFEDAENAAALWNKADGLSLGDRFCIALGNRMNAIIWTADSAWNRYERVRLIR